jgi:hypothetical protein
MLILDKARTLEFLIDRASRVDVPDLYVRDFDPPEAAVAVSQWPLNLLALPKREPAAEREPAPAWSFAAAG